MRPCHHLFNNGAQSPSVAIVATLNVDWATDCDWSLSSPFGKVSRNIDKFWGLSEPIHIFLRCLGKRIRWSGFCDLTALTRELCKHVACHPGMIRCSCLSISTLCWNGSNGYPYEISDLRIFVPKESELASREAFCGRKLAIFLFLLLCCTAIGKGGFIIFAD